MVWTALLGVLALVAGAVVVALRHRHAPQPSVGAVSASWIAEHQSDVER